MIRKPATGVRAVCAEGSPAVMGSRPTAGARWRDGGWVPPSRVSPLGLVPSLLLARRERARDAVGAPPSPRARASAACQDLRVGGGASVKLPIRAMVPGARADYGPASLFTLSSTTPRLGR